MSSHRIVTIPTYQPHPVPARPHAPRGPFPPELFYTGGVNYDYTPQGDDGEPEVPPEPTMFRCRLCGNRVHKNDLPDHFCEGMASDGEEQRGGEPA